MCIIGLFWEFLTLILPPSSVLISSPPIKALPFPPLTPLAHLHLSVFLSIAPCSDVASFDFLLSAITQG